MSFDRRIVGRWFDEREGVAAPAGLVREGLGDVGFVDTDGSAEDRGLAGFDESEGGRVPDDAGGHLGL